MWLDFLKYKEPDISTKYNELMAQEEEYSKPALKGKVHGNQAIP